MPHLRISYISSGNGLKLLVRQPTAFFVACLGDSGKFSSFSFLIYAFLGNPFGDFNAVFIQGRSLVIQRPLLKLVINPGLGDDLGVSFCSSVVFCGRPSLHV